MPRLFADDIVLYLFFRTEYYIKTKIAPHNTKVIVSREEMRKTMTAVAAEESSSLHLLTSRSDTKSAQS